MAHLVVAHTRLRDCGDLAEAKYIRLSERAQLLSRIGFSRKTLLNSQR